MIIHYYTLYHLVSELQTLIGCRLTECFTQERNSLVMKFSDGINDYFVQYYCSQPNTSLFIKNNYSRAKKNSKDLFGSIVGEVLQFVKIHDNNRIIHFKFINTSIYVFLFGGPNSNLIAVNRDNKIIHSLKSPKDLLGNKLEIPKPNLQEFEEFSKDTKVLDALSKCNVNLGAFLAEEVLERMNISPEVTIEELSEYETKKLLIRAEEIRQECLQTNDFFICETDTGLLLTLIQLSKYPDYIQKFTSISDAINKRVVADIRKKSYNSLFKEISSNLERQRKRLVKNIEIFRDENTIIERVNNYKLYAELLLAHPTPKIKSGNAIVLSDYSGNEVQILLDNKLTIIDNSNKYFIKSRKAKEELKIRKQRLPEMELKLIKIENALKSLEDAETYRDLEVLRKNVKEITVKRNMNEKENLATKFREFDLGEGYLLYVGRNAANNDELTMKFAKPNDIWFHARGSGGSHVVLRVHKEQKPPKHIIKKAASVAAYYSQARNAKYVPVAYTFKKYVRKPKGANTGSVIISREEVILVEPGLIEGQKDGKTEGREH
ncbi:MAG: NFACT family protein [bacterium]